MRWGWIALLLVGCTTRAACPPGELALPAPRPPAFVLLRSDWTTSALALLDADGTPIVTDWLDSGTHVSTLVTSLGGDPALPSTPLGPRTIAWIDRSPVDVLSLRTADALTQIDMRAEPEGARTGSSVNPHDAAALGDGRLLVVRPQPSIDPGAPELARGNDVVVVQGGRVTQRIALDADQPLRDCSGSDCTAYAGPASIVPLGAHTFLVALDRFNLRFDRPGDGAVIGIDRDTLEASTPVSLAPLENCRSVALDPRDATRAYVLCAGSFEESPDARRPVAGIAEITVDASGALVLGDVWQAPVGMPVVGTGLVALGGGRVLAVANEGTVTSDTPPDHLLEIDVTAGTAREVYVSMGGFVLGDGVLSGTTVLVPDAERGGVMRVDVSGPATAGELVPIDDCVGLPPRQIRPVAF